jgi:hypothetical protein
MRGAGMPESETVESGGGARSLARGDCQLECPEMGARLGGRGRSLFL